LGSVELVTLDTVEKVMVELGAWHSACCVGEAEMCYCIVRDEDGRWSVFYLERGDRGSLRTFTDEQAACLEFMARAAGKATVDAWLTERGRPDLIPSVNPLL